MKQKSELETNLFDKAMEWYQSGDHGKKEAALELFPEDLLESEIENFKKRNKKERLKARDEELKTVLERCKKMFPVGTLVWSDDSYSDINPLLIVGEPYIGSTKYNSHVPDSKYHYWEDKDVEHKTVLAHAIRICHGSVDTESMSWTKVNAGLEKILIEMDKPKEKRFGEKDYFVKLKDYVNKEKALREKEISQLKSDIGRYQEQIDKWKEKLNMWELYNPADLTETKLKQLLDYWKW